MSAPLLDKLVWWLIFGGLITLGLGLALRGDAAWLGRLLAFAGGAAALVGAVLIWVRSRLPTKGDE